MPHDQMTPERAFARLHRLSIELHESAMRNDVDGVNRAAELIPFAMEHVTLTGLPHNEHTDEMVCDIRDAFLEADLFLQSRMADIRQKLTQFAYSKKVRESYFGTP